MAKTTKGLPDGRIINADDGSMESAFQSMATALGNLRPGESLSDYVARRPEVIREHVEAIAAAVKEADAFDVIELMRLRETPMVLDGYRESLSDQMPTAVDVVALILLARGARVSPATDVKAGQPSKVIPDLHNHARALLSIGQFMLLSTGQAEKFGPLTTLAATYVGHEINVKFKQYAHIHDRLNDALFRVQFCLKPLVLPTRISWTFVKPLGRSIWTASLQRETYLVMSPRSGRQVVDPASRLSARSKVGLLCTISCSIQGSAQALPRQTLLMHHRCQRTVSSEYLIDLASPSGQRPILSQRLSRSYQATIRFGTRR